MCIRDRLQEAQEVAQLTQILGKGKQDGGLRDGVTYFRNTPLPTYQSRLRSKFAALRQKLAPFTRESVPPALPDDRPPGADPSP